MKSKKEIIDIINKGASTNDYYRFTQLPNFPVATDGAISLAQAAECFWLLDIIGSHQGNPKLDKAFQVWKLEVNLDKRTAVVRGYNDTTLIVTQRIPFTDFPLDSVKLYLINGVILLPSEFFKLKPGDNVLIYEDSQQSRNVSYKILWKDLWL